MEFVEYREVLPGLREQGLVEVTESDGLARLEIEPGPKRRTLHFRDPASAVEPYHDATVINRPKSRLAEVVRLFLGKVHMNEVLVVPVGLWRDVIDCVAFNLASDPDWVEMDAIAAVQQNTRNPLAIPRSEMGVLTEMIAALIANGSSSRHDLIVTSDVTPLLVEVFHDGAVSITCDAGFADSLAKSVRDQK